MAINLVSTFTDIASDNRFLQDMREAIINKAFFDDADQFFRIVPGIKGGQQVVALDAIEYVTTKDKGCGLSTTSSFNLSGIEQKWEPTLAKVHIKMCYSEFMGAFTQWGLANGYDVHKLNEANFFDFINDMTADAVKADFMRLALFGDADIAEQSILADANKAEHYDVVKKGLLPTLQYFNTVASLQSQFIDLSANDEATRVAQLALDSDYAVGLMESLTDGVYFNYDHILTSETLANNYKKWLTRGGGNIPLESSKAEVQAGLSNLVYGGSPIRYSRFHDKKRLEDFTIDNGAGSLVTHLPHFALAIDKNNMAIGVDDVASLTDLRLEYVGGDDENFHIKGNYFVDFKIPNPKALKAAL